MMVNPGERDPSDVFEHGFCFGRDLTGRVAQCEDAEVGHPDVAIAVAVDPCTLV